MTRPLIPLPSATTVTDGGAGLAPLSPVVRPAFKPGDRVRISYGWPLLEQHVDGVLQGFRNDGYALVRWDDDIETAVEPHRLTLAPPRNDGFGIDWKE